MKMKENLEDIAWGIAIFFVFACLFWAILALPAGAQTLPDEDYLTFPTSGSIWIRGDSLVVNDSTFVLLQRLNKPKFGWITDSITWVTTDTTFARDCRCEHEWIYSKPYATALRVGELVYRKSSRVIVCVAGYHPLRTRLEGGASIHDEDEHCPYEANEREKICRKCMRSVIEREKWFQRYVLPPKSEFELLKEKQNARHH